MSQGSKKKSANRRLPPNIAKMASSDTVVVWFVPVLTRGKLHIETLSENFPGETQEADLTEPEDRAATLLSWSVGELARFLAKKDMEGPAQQLRTQGVAGEDFSAMTEQVLQKELHFSTFTSRKLIKIRDTYLAQDR